MNNKKIIFSFLLVFSLISVVKAQYCNFFAMSKGMVLSYENYDSKGKLKLKSRTTCVDVITANSGAVIYKANTSVYNADDVILEFWEYEMKCKDGIFNLSMGSFTDPKLMKEYDDKDIIIDTTGMVYPSELSVGMSLPDAAYSVSSTEIGVTMKTYNVKVTNRKVVGFESVTVPAGTFECCKITYDMEVDELYKKKSNVTEYISEGVGLIKSDIYNNKGKLTSSKQLVELKK